jgi:hypothetical protein
MPDKRKFPWKPIAITTAAGLVLSVGSCFGLIFSINGAIPTWAQNILWGLVLAGALIFVVGFLALIVVGLVRLVLGPGEDKS